MSALFTMNQRGFTAEESGEVALNTIFKISELYDKEMEDYYLRTGNSFDERIQGDIQTCTEVHSLLKEGMAEQSE